MSRARQPWMKFYPSDWRADPALRMCSVAARGLWMEMLCIMHEADPKGSLVLNARPLNERQLAGLAGASPNEVRKWLAELETAGVFSRESDGTIFSRRIRRDVERDAVAASAGSRGGNPEIRRGTVPKEQRVRPFKRSDSPRKTERIYAKSDGKCHWCGDDLPWDNWHVDHVLPICDGGTNDEKNLVASCPDCNHRRARISYPTPTLVMVGTHSDTNAQKPEARIQTNPCMSPEGDDHPIVVEGFFGGVARPAPPPVETKPKRKRGVGEKFIATEHTLPAEPTAEMIAFAAAGPGKPGWVNGKLQDLFTTWRDHHIKAATKIAASGGLEASWRTWVNNARNNGWGVKPNAPALPENDAGLFAAVAGPPAWTDEWVKRFREWAFNQIWDEAKLGPAPYQPGYRGPEIDAARQAIYEAALRKGCWGAALGLEAIERHKRNQGRGA